MHAEKFGDSFDFVKRGLLHGLAPPDSWVAHPMLYRRKGNTGPGGGLDVRAYRMLLGLPPGAVRWGIQHTRADLIKNVRNMPEKNLFIDPDTGITREDQKAYTKFVKLKDVVIAAKCRSGRLVLVFDQSFGRNKGDPPHEQQAKAKADDLRLSGVSCAAYFVSKVPGPTYFYWVSTNQTTVTCATQSLQQHMGIPECRLRRFYRQDPN